MTYKLIGSASTMRDLCSLIESRWGWSNVTEVQSTVKGVYWIRNDKGIIDGVRIIKKGNRFRFEMKVSE